jgi:deoxyribodipyrimidine photo-lyase
VVTDDYPVFIPARHNASVPAKIGIPYIAFTKPRVRRLHDPAKDSPRIAGLSPAGPAIKLRRPWQGDFSAIGDLKPSGCDIDHDVAPSLTYTGGYTAARKRLDFFLQQKLSRYAKESREPSRHATSNLSPYLHSGQISSLEVALAVRIMRLNTSSSPMNFSKS